jgi:hypothetical protein
MNYREVAQQFGDCIVRNDYASAWSLLTMPLQSSTSPEAIEKAVITMSAHATGAIVTAQVMEDCVLEAWPGKQARDLAVVYVALNGDSFSEAVSLTLAEVGDSILIRNLEWGRP